MLCGVRQGFRRYLTQNLAGVAIDDLDDHPSRLLADLELQMSVDIARVSVGLLRELPQVVELTRLFLGKPGSVLLLSPAIHG